MNKFMVSRAKNLAHYWKGLGPGLTTGAADDDPSGIATYSQAGAMYKYNFLWLALFTFPFMSIVQEMCARIGLVTGRGLSGIMRKHYPRPVLLVLVILLLCANSLNIGANLGAMSKAVQLIYPKVPFFFLLVSFSLATVVMQILIPYKIYAKYLKYLTFVLLSYILCAFIVKVDWSEVAISTVVPKFAFSREEIIVFCGILGTTISPYLFFWQTSQEIEEEIVDGKKFLKDRMGTNKAELGRMRSDVWSGMFISNLVMFFIILTCGATLNVAGITTIKTASDAADALRPIAGDRAYLLFSVGIIGSGLLSIPVLAGSASYALSEAFGWREGLWRKYNEASAFYGAIIFSVGVGFFINIVGIDAIIALFASAVFNGIVSPIILVFIILVSANEKIMGTYKNSRIINIAGWFIALLMGVTSIATIFSIFIT